MLGAHPHQQPPHLVRRPGPAQLRLPQADAHRLPPALLLQQLHQPVRLRLPKRQLPQQLPDRSRRPPLPQEAEDPRGPGAEPDRHHVAQLRQVHVRHLMAEGGARHETRGEIRHGHVKEKKDMSPPMSFCCPIHHLEIIIDPPP